MQITTINPKQALNKAFLKLKPKKSEIELFAQNFSQLIKSIDDNESEEFHKNLVIDFLKKTYYDPNHFVNTKGRNDLVIHNGSNASSTVGVIVETKKPTNRAEMITQENINSKAFHELILYYLRERITHKNLEIKHLIATNINEWFVFDVSTFDRLFAQNKKFVKQFEDFENGRLADTKTEFFYTQVAQDYVSEHIDSIEFTYFNLQEYSDIIDEYLNDKEGFFNKPPRTADSTTYEGDKTTPSYGHPSLKGGELKKLDYNKLQNLPYLKTFRKELRNNLTPAEAALWKVLKNKQLDGRKFRRQHSVGNYILDFYCPEEKLAIELDGDGHFNFDQAEYDRERDLFLEATGIKVLRFENKWVWDNLAGVLQAIRDQFNRLSSLVSERSRTIRRSTPSTEVKQGVSSSSERMEGGGSNSLSKLIALYKLLSPEHLLKLPFANDSNTLDRTFYSELLHIIGLEETRSGGKRLIQRYKEGSRNKGSLIENAIMQIEALSKISRLKNPSLYGETYNEQLFNVALELVITWINRILFLKLLEAQLISYHKGDLSYQFLDYKIIKDYDELNKLFFHILAVKTDERREGLRDTFAKVPYLNSSLFEPTEIEHEAVFISNLEDEFSLPIHSSTVLKDQQGKRLKGDMGALKYLFEFLSAYDFAHESAGEVQEDNKTLINASVLGLIFEKINGYKDGSFFTPGYITMYMCRETIRKSVIQKFNDAKKWNCKSIDELYDKIEDRQEANAIINSIKICDPAVGSGHFLVSALNEIIAIKNDLRILQDRNGARLKEYHCEVVNDELIITDDEGELYEYNPNSRESQRVQEALFHEKQTIIENSLFGVDINPNSVKICRLRLWIELLKSAYYIQDSAIQMPQLQTLPNIDINIKCGNSLVSRFALDADLKKALKSKKWNIDSYRLAVASYINAENKEQKCEMERLITEIKSDFRSEIAFNAKEVKDLRKASGELYQLTNQTQMFEKTEQEKKKWQEDVESKTNKIKELEEKIEEIKSNKIFENAFEWRFEFPEVLNDDGDFVGFDAIIGNPPYIQLQAMKEVSEELKRFDYLTYEKTGDIYSLFYERGVQVMHRGGYLGYITSNKWMRAGYGKTTRNYFINHTQPIRLIDLGSGIFEEATVDSNLLIVKKADYTHEFEALDVSKEKDVTDLYQFHPNMLSMHPQKDESWVISSPLERSIKQKIEAIGKPLKEWDIQINYGIKTGYNEAFIIDGAKKEELIAQDPKSAEIIKPILRGRDIKRYKAEFADLWLINSHNGVKGKFDRIDVEKDYPAIYQHLLQYEERLKKRSDKGEHWTNLRNCAYLEEFEKEKIVYNDICQELTFSLVEKSIYFNNTAYFINDNSYILLTFLNSKAINWYYKQISVQLGDKAVRMFSIYVENIPIPNLSPEEQAPFVSLVEQILHAKEHNQDTTALEREIDLMVYELYGLTEEEIAVVES